jgi:hypothetical protein
LVDLFSPTWRNPANAAFNRQRLYYNGVRALGRVEAWYAFDVPSALWTQKYWDTLAKAIKRADGQYLAFNNVTIIRGISSVPIAGSVPVSDSQGWLVQALRGILPPEVMAAGKRFHPLWGTREIKKQLNKPIDTNKHKLQLVAKSQKATDYPVLEASLREAGLEYFILRSILKQQAGYGLSARMRNWEHAEDFLRGLQLYTLLNRRV